MWLSGWAKRKKITIDSSKIDSDSDTDKKKVAFTKADGTTQLYAEIEQFDATNQKAVYWVSKSDWVISSSSDTEFYVYYDSSQSDNTTYIGDTPGSAPATNVWDSNYQGVWHHSQSPTGNILDSSSNGRDLTSSGSMTSDDLVDGKIAKGLDFDGTDDVLYRSSGSVGLANAWTVEHIFKGDTWSGSQFLFSLRPSSGVANGIDIQNGTYNYEIEFFDSNGSTIKDYARNSAFSTGTWYVLTVTWDGTNLKIYVNGTEDTNINKRTDGSGSQTSTDRIISLWARYTTSQYYFDGIGDEVRLSSTARSAAWIKASYNSGNNTLLTFGSEETGTITISVSETIALTDSISRNFSLKKILSETINLIDSIDKRIEFKRVLSDIVSLTDTITKKINFRRFLSQTITLTDSVLTKVLGVTRIMLSETIKLTDTIARNTVVSRLIQETIKLTDTVSTKIAGAYQIVVSETIKLTDSLNKHFKVSVRVIESITLTPVISVTRRAWYWAKKHIPSWSFRNKNVIYLLQEDSSKILQEDGGGILSSSSTPSWSFGSKSSSPTWKWKNKP